jgi:hypothetical protein
MKLLKNEKDFINWSRVDLHIHESVYVGKPEEYPCWSDYHSHVVIYLYRSDLERMLKEMK